jgi:hypothetical protein
MSPNDLIGKKFNRLTVIRTWTVPKRRICEVVCDCGSVKSVRLDALTKGTTKSCGCLNKEMIRPGNVTHGKSKLKAYAVWNGMIQRCTNKNLKGFMLYGGRGISVCERWRKSFADFLFDMGDRPSNRHSIERIDNNGNYEPGNCCWATAKEQSLNQRRSRLIEFKGETLNLCVWATRYGMSDGLLWSRLNAGWNMADALEIPPKKGRNQYESRR